MQPHFDLDKIKFATDPPTFKRAVGLYEGGKVRDFKEEEDEFTATVIGTSPYSVSVSAWDYDEGSCTCYLGQGDVLCKHMVAVALYAILKGAKLPAKDAEIRTEAVFSGKVGELSAEDFAKVKESVSAAMKYIKPYNGPSRIWFSYQNSLSEGSARISAIISELPASEQTSQYLVSLLLRLDKKLCTGGVDDSDGTVGGLMCGIVGVLQEFAREKPECIKTFKKFCGVQTCFEWEEPLVRLFDECR